MNGAVGSAAEVDDEVTQIIASFTNAIDKVGFASVASGGQLVLVAWSDNRSNTIRRRRSLDAGATLKPAIKIASHNGLDASPGVAASGKPVYVSWVVEYPLMGVRAKDGSQAPPVDQLGRLQGCRESQYSRGVMTG